MLKIAVRVISIIPPLIIVLWMMSMDIMSIELSLPLFIILYMYSLSLNYDLKERVKLFKNEGRHSWNVSLLSPKLIYLPAVQCNVCGIYYNKYGKVNTKCNDEKFKKLLI